MKRQFLDIEGVCEYVTLSKSTIYKMVAKNQIPYHKIGSRTVFDMDEINNWVHGQAVTKTEPTFLEIKSFLN